MPFFETSTLHIADLWRSSALIQGTMALMGFGSLCYLALTGAPTPDILAALVGTIIGYYFGSKQRTTTT